MGSIDSGPNSIASQDLEKLRGRARKAEIDDPYAGAVIRSWKTDAIGVGISTNFLHTNQKFVEELRGHWRRWVNHADFDERFDFGGLCAAIFGCVVRDGEAIVMRRMGFVAKGVVGLQLQHLPSDHLPTDQYASGYENVPEGNRVVMGVEFAPNGKRVAYHLYQSHPNEYLRGFQGKNRVVRHGADRVLHIHRPQTPGEARSVSWLAPVLTRLSQMNDLDDAMLNRSRIASAITGLVKGAPNDDATIPAIDGVDEKKKIEAEIEVGSLLDLAPGEEATWPEVPDYPAGQDAFTNAQLRSVAAGTGRTEWSISADYSRVNYSSIRAGNSASNRETEAAQWGFFIPQCNRRVVRWFMQAGALDGTFSAELRQAYLSAPEEFDFEFTTHGFPFVDPLKESLAAVSDIQNGITSRSEVIRGRGGNPEDVDNENAADRSREKRLNLTYGEQQKDGRGGEKRKRADAAAIQPNLFTAALLTEEPSRLTQ